MLDLTLTDEQVALQRAAAAFADKWLVPNANRMDAERELDPKVLQEAARLGFYGCNVPREHGGLGLDTIGMGLVAGELGRACGSTALSLFAHTVLCCEHIGRRGTPEQKKTYLPKLASGDWVGGWAVTEPGGGSDVGAMRTTATPDGDGWVLSGEKCFITNGSRGDVVVVTARTPRGFGSFIVERGTAGLTASRSHDLTCMRASDTASVRLDGCRLGAGAVLGDPSRALHDAFACLDLERVVAGAMMTAMARELLARSVAYSLRREAFGRPIGRFQAVAAKLANLDVAVASSEALWLRAAWRRDRGEPFTREAAAAKLSAARLAQHAAHEAIQIHAGAGLEVATGLERMLRDSLIGGIGGGTSEIMELVIAREMGLGIDPGG